MGWQEELVKAFREAVKGEESDLRECNKDRLDCHYHVKDLKERQLQYLLFKRLLNNRYFKTWQVMMEQPYGEKKGTAPKRRHVDFWLVSTKCGKPDYQTETCVEMKEWNRKAARKDHKRLHQYANVRGLLLYRFGKRKLQLEDKARKIRVFKPLSCVTGDELVDGLDEDVKPIQYYFQAILLNW